MADPQGTYRYAGEEIASNQQEFNFKPDTVVTVREVVPAGETGAHTDTEDSVVVEFEQEGQVITDWRYEEYTSPEPLLDADGNTRIDDGGNQMFVGVRRTRSVPILGTGTILRAWAFPVDVFERDFVKEGV